MKLNRALKTGIFSLTVILGVILSIIPAQGQKGYP